MERQRGQRERQLEGEGQRRERGDLRRQRQRERQEPSPGRRRCAPGARPKVLPLLWKRRVLQERMPSQASAVQQLLEDGAPHGDVPCSSEVAGQQPAAAAAAAAARAAQEGCLEGAMGMHHLLEDQRGRAFSEVQEDERMHWNLAQQIVQRCDGRSQVCDVQKYTGAAAGRRPREAEGGARSYRGRAQRPKGAAEQHRSPERKTQRLRRILREAADRCPADQKSDPRAREEKEDAGQCTEASLETELVCGTTTRPK